jgi:hypothetical protein
MGGAAANQLKESPHTMDLGSQSIGFSPRREDAKDPKVEVFPCSHQGRSGESSTQFFLEKCSDDPIPFQAHSG